MGKFKNKLTTIESFGTDEKTGQPLVNNRPMLTFRIKKLMKQKNETMLKSQLKKIIKEEINSYQKFFKSVLDKFEVKSPNELSEEKKKEFFDYIDKNYKSENESIMIKEENKYKDIFAKVEKSGSDKFYLFNPNDNKIIERHIPRKNLFDRAEIYFEKPLENKSLTILKSGNIDKEGSYFGIA